MLMSALNNARITSSIDGLYIIGELEEATGGLHHLQNFITKFGGSLSLVSGKYSISDGEFHYYSWCYNDLDNGINYRFMINVSPETYARQYTSFYQHDLVVFKAVEVTLVDNSYLVLPYDEAKFTKYKKSVVN